MASPDSSAYCDVQPAQPDELDAPTECRPVGSDQSWFLQAELGPDRYSEMKKGKLPDLFDRFHKNALRFEKEKVNSNVKQVWNGARAATETGEQTGQTGASRSENCEGFSPNMVFMLTGTDYM